MAKIIEVLVPTAEPTVEKFLVNPRAQDLNGKVIGFLWDEKPNGDFLLKYLKKQISRNYKVVGTEWAQVNGVHIAAEDAPEVQQIANVADMVIIAIGD
jgi:hypothetical protein